MMVSMFPEKAILPVTVMLADSSERQPGMLHLINAIQQHLFLEKVAVLAVLLVLWLTMAR